MPLFDWCQHKLTCDDLHSCLIRALGTGVWAYFQFVEGDNTKVICKVCQEDEAYVLISRGGTQ